MYCACWWDGSWEGDGCFLSMLWGCGVFSWAGVSPGMNTTDLSCCPGEYSDWFKIRYTSFVWVIIIHLAWSLCMRGKRPSELS